MARTSEELCGKLIEHAARQCAATPATPAPVAPSFDALASTFAGLSVATTWVAVGITGLAIVVALAGFAWGRAIVREAKEDARDEVNRLINAWLLDQAPQIIREAINLQNPPPPPPPGDVGGDAADEIGRAAG